MIRVGCQSLGCYADAAMVYNGVVSVASRHSGNEHINAVALPTLLELLELSKLGEAAWPLLATLSPANVVRPVVVNIPMLGDPRPGIELVCSLSKCDLPWAYVVNGHLVIESYHRHEHHVNNIPLSSFQVFLSAVSATGV